MQNNSFDLIIIGAGPGGYVGAIRASQLGMNVWDECCLHRKTANAWRYLFECWLYSVKGAFEYV